MFWQALTLDCQSQNQLVEAWRKWENVLNTYYYFLMKYYFFSFSIGKFGKFQYILLVFFSTYELKIIRTHLDLPPHIMQKIIFWISGWIRPFLKKYKKMVSPLMENSIFLEPFQTYLFWKNSPPCKLCSPCSIPLKLNSNIF